MSSRTIKTIITLNLTLCLTIEAAQAGLLHKIKLFLLQEFNLTALTMTAMAFIVILAVLYILLAPVSIGRQKSVWLNMSEGSKPNGMGHRKAQVRRISAILHREAA